MNEQKIKEEIDVLINSIKEYQKQSNEFDRTNSLLKQYINSQIKISNTMLDIMKKIDDLTDELTNKITQFDSMCDKINIFLDKFDLQKEDNGDFDKENNIETTQENEIVEELLTDNKINNGTTID